MESWSRACTLALLLLLAVAPLSTAQQYVVVTVYGEPATCLSKVAAFSNTRNMPVRLSKTGEATWVSEPVPKGELITIAYEHIAGCFNYVAVNEDTLEKFYNVDRIAVYATYNVTITINANTYTPPATTPTPQEAPVSHTLEQIIQAITAMIPYVLVIAAVYAGIQVSRKALQRSRKTRAEQQSLKRVISTLKQASGNPVIKRGWLWMDVDPASEVVHGTDPDRKIASYLKLARVLPAGRDRMERIFQETLDRAYMPAIVGHGSSHAGTDPGEDLIWYAVELAQDDTEIDRAFTRIEKAGGNPYLIPTELAGLDEIIKRYRGMPMEDLGFRYAEELEKQACPLCGNKTLKGARYCTSCGGEIKKTAEQLTAKKPGKQIRTGPTHSPQKVDLEPLKPYHPTARAEPERRHHPEPTPKQWKAEEHKPGAGLETIQPEEKTPPLPPAEPARPGKEKPTSQPAPPQATPEPAEKPAEKPLPTPPVPPPKRQDSQPEELAEVEWEPDKGLVEFLQDMGIPATDFRREAFRLANLREDDRSYERELMRSADRLASLVEGLDDDFRTQVMMSLSQRLRDAAFVVRKELRPPEPPKPETVKPLEKAEPQQTPEPAVPVRPPPIPEAPKPPPEPEKPAMMAKPASIPEKPVEKPATTAEVGYEALLKAGAEPGHVYILDLPRSAVPTAMVANKVRNTVNVEVSSGAGPGAVLALMRTTYRANYKSMVRPAPNHPYVKRLARLVSSGAGGGVITTSEIYGMLGGIFAQRGFKPVAVRLDTAGTAERLAKSVADEQVVKRLARLFTLMPEAADLFLAGGAEGLRQHFQNILGPEDGEELYMAVKAVISGETRYVNKPLMISLGMLDEAG